MYRSHRSLFIVLLVAGLLGTGAPATASPASATTTVSTRTARAVPAGVRRDGRKFARLAHAGKRKAALAYGTAAAYHWFRADGVRPWQVQECGPRYGHRRDKWECAVVDKYEELFEIGFVRRHHHWFLRRIYFDPMD